MSSNKSVKYAELVIDWLVQEGYTHCYFVAGGNIMHLLDGCRSRMVCVPVVHEVAAGIAVEYFNESGGDGRAFALVTAGPGLTNIITAMAGAWLESRELLVLGGQVKAEDLMSNGIRQRGIQEIDGVSLAAPVCKVAERIEQPWPQSRFLAAARQARQDRPGPVFLELCLDAQGAPVDPVHLSDIDDAWVAGSTVQLLEQGAAAANEIARLTKAAERPIWLLGGGVSRSTAAELHDELVALGVPLMTTWNGADRLSRLDTAYVGRPNTWGQRSANVLVNEADLVVVFGSRLGIQQTGFNWRAWAANATVVQIDVDEHELSKGHPEVAVRVHGDANTALRGAVESLASHVFDGRWLNFCQEIRRRLPLRESCNVTAPGYVSPYDFYAALADITNKDDVVIPCSSGGANSTALQVFEPIAGQIMITDKGLASMGYGLAGAIGASMAWPGRRTILIEGDGGFTQSLQELATVGVNALPIKIFVFANNGYGSIRTTQRNYFGGAYLGCDTETGLGFPDWRKLFDSYGIPSVDLRPGWETDPAFLDSFGSSDPQAYIVPIDPEQTYWPKITSRITEAGSMESNPLHAMTPDLAPDVVEFIAGFTL